MNYVLITGCSTGIGYETAKYLTQKNFNIITSCRKKVDVERLSRTVTAYPFLIKILVKFEPINPAPPVIKIFFMLFGYCVMLSF